MAKKQKNLVLKIKKPTNRKIGFALFLLLPILFLTVYLTQQPQTFLQLAQQPNQDGQPGQMCDENTLLDGEQSKILEELCLIDKDTDACKDGKYCKRTAEEDDAKCAPGGIFGPPLPPPPPVQEAPAVNQAPAPGGNRRVGTRRPAKKRPAPKKILAPRGGYAGKSPSTGKPTTCLDFSCGINPPGQPPPPGPF
jgi:hypothetical protein